MRHPVIHALVVALLVSAAACHTSSEAQISESERVREQAKVLPVVVFDPGPGKRSAVTVEIVRSPEQIQRGLMFRRSMPADHGMLFLMGKERVHSFWMRNTYIPLDMIFIGRDMRVAGVIANTEPLTDDSRRLSKPSYYVLEVNAGWAATHGVSEGARVRFKNVVE